MVIIQRAFHSSSILHGKQWGGGHPLCPESHMMWEWGEGGSEWNSDGYLQRKQPMFSQDNRRRPELLQMERYMDKHHSETRTYYSRLFYVHTPVISMQAGLSSDCCDKDNKRQNFPSQPAQSLLYFHYMESKGLLDLLATREIGQFIG